MVRTELVGREREVAVLGEHLDVSKAAKLIEQLHASDSPTALTRRERDVAELSLR